MNEYDIKYGYLKDIIVGDIVSSACYAYNNECGIFRVIMTFGVEDTKHSFKSIPIIRLECVMSSNDNIYLIAGHQYWWQPSRWSKLKKL